MERTGIASANKNLSDVIIQVHPCGLGRGDLHRWRTAPLTVELAAELDRVRSCLARAGTYVDGPVSRLINAAAPGTGAQSSDGGPRPAAITGPPPHPQVSSSAEGPWDPPLPARVDVAESVFHCVIAFIFSLSFVEGKVNMMR